MPLYQYPQPSALDRVTVIKTEKGGYRAYLHLRPGGDPNLARTIRDTIDAQGWQSIPIMFQNQPMLEVRGLKSEKQLISLLEQNSWAQGKPSTLPTPGDILSTQDIIAKRSLQASGALYTLGDLSFIRYGMKGKSALDIAGGWSYLAGTLALLGYGRNDRSNAQVEDISKQMVSYLQKNQHLIPKDSALTRIAQEKEKGILQQTEDVIARYPSEAFCIATAMAGAFITAAAIRGKVFPAKTLKDKISAWSDVGLGLTTVASTMLGLVVTEKHHDPDGPKPQNDLERAWRWVQEKPLRVTGYGLMVSTAFHALSTSIDLQKALRTKDKAGLAAIPSRAMFVALSMSAEFLMSISSKGHGEGVESDKSVEDSMIGIAAEMISRESPQHHEYLIQHMTHFLGHQNALGSKNVDVERELREAVHHINRNPWAIRTDQPQQTAPAAMAQAPISYQQRLAPSPHLGVPAN